MSVHALSGPGLAAMEEARPSHVRWSELNGEFLDHVARNPEYLGRDLFASVRDAAWLRTYDLQAWPLFMGVEQRAEAAALALGLDRLIKGVMERFLANDPARILRFYAGGEAGAFASMSEAALGVILKEPDGIRSLPSRLDLVEDADGLKCLEYNAGSRLGGLQAGGVGELYLACPPIAEFLRANGRRARAPDPVGALVRHLVDETARMGAWSGGDFNFAVLVLPNEEDHVDSHPAEMYARVLPAVLREHGISGGHAFACAAGDLRDEGGTLFHGEHPVHLVIDMHDGTSFPRALFRLFKEGRINFVSGPIGSIASDKRNLALISENAGSDEFTAPERALIERHLPWTRRVLPGLTRFRGRGLRLPDGLPEHREALVLKKGYSMGGTHVLVGRFRTDAQWRDDVARAAREGSWIAQEYVEPLPYFFQRGEHGATRHDLAWGLFAFGDHYGGTLTRMLPCGGNGVVNAMQGAELGTCLELVD